MQDWKQLKKRHTDLAQLELENSDKERLIAELEEAIQELKSIEKGSKQARPSANLLDEL